MQNLVYRDKRAIAKARGAKPGGTHGLKHRYEEQVNGRCGPGTDSWKNHDDQLRGQRDKLTRYVRAYENKIPPCGVAPDDIVEWVDKALPSADDWKGDKNAPVPPECNKATAPAKAPAPQPVPVPPAVPAPGQQPETTPAPAGGSSIDGSDIAKAAVVVGEVALGVVAVAAVIAGAPALAGAAAAAAIVVGLGSLLGGGSSPDSA